MAMDVACAGLRQTAAESRSSITPRRCSISPRRRLFYLALAYLVGLAACSLVAEVVFRLISDPKYWVHTSRLLVGTGQTEAGKKWWPNTTFLVDSSEFHTSFHTNAYGYRARPGGVPDSGAFRIAFVGDSFTEGMQVPYESTFVARLETALNEGKPARRVVCENFGVSATDLLDYWHRIVHDVIPTDAPDALVLCIYPGNDFQCIFPDDAFASDGHPLFAYYRRPAWTQHVKAWINLHSKFGSFLQRTVLSIGARKPLWQSQGPKNWWAHPEVAATATDAPAVRRSRAIFSAIDRECRQNHVQLCVLVVGPVETYFFADGKSPLATIVAEWGLDIPVIDVAAKAVARPDYKSLTYPFDGHLTAAGHTYLAEEAAPQLSAVLLGSRPMSRR